MKQDKWVKLIDNVEIADNNLSKAIQNIESNLIYKGFNLDDEPVLDMGSNHELILSWNMIEMFPFIFIQIMKTKGFISPDDFK